jgi:hypothetical protein
MSIDTRCAMLFAACGHAVSALRLRRKHDNEKQAHKADLPEWEKGDGNLAPPSEAPDALGTTGSA